jgi:uncharacterized membrane protein YcaP (DUF421 family)
MTVQEVFGSGPSLTWWQECDRAVVVFIYGLLIVRLAGRRVFGKWAALDIIVSIMIGSSLSRIITGTAQLGGTLVATAVLMALHFLLAQAAARWPWASRVLEGAPVVLARDGQLLHRSRMAQAVSQNDIAEALRESQMEDVGETRLVMLESSGKISVLKGQK